MTRGRPHESDLVDGHGRAVRDLRISITDRCNFRCTYCMPEEGMQWLPREDILTFEEIERVARLFVSRYAVDSIRLTGGEPTVRAQLPALVAKLAALRQPDGSAIDLSMTTNGASLGLVAPDLRAAGLDRVNVSLDSLRAERFMAVTKRDALDRVLDGIDSAIRAGFSPVKVNCVVMHGVNDDEVVEFAAFGRERGVIVRFIEWMPLDAQGSWTGEAVVPAQQILDQIASRWPIEPVGSLDPDGDDEAPAERWRYVDGGGEIGVIASVTRPFCATCDRVRLTAEGALRNCLFALKETDLRALLRSGASDDDLDAAIRADVSGKWAGHQIGQVTFVQPPRSMSQIGG